MSAVSLRLKVEQARRPNDEVVALEDWLRQARIHGLRARRETLPIQPGEMGPELLPILTLVLSSTVLAELIKTLHGWLTSRRRQIALELEVGGHKIRIESQGSETVDELLRRVRPLLSGAPAP
jgi:Effector Associated Constant Component 1